MSRSATLTVKKLQELLEKSIPHPYPAPRDGTPSAVLFLISLRNERIVLMRRPALDSDPHSGQVSFPGGRIEPHDLRPLEDMRNVETWKRAAIREFREETGNGEIPINVLGALPEVGTTTGYVIYPILAVTPQELNLDLFNPDPNEVESLILPKFSDFFDPAIYRLEHRIWNHVHYPVHYYQIQSHTIWGATAAILYNFTKRFQD